MWAWASNCKRVALVFLLLGVTVPPAAATTAAPADAERPAATPAVPRATLSPYRIAIVEKGTGWPVPLVQLRTVHQVTLVSDNAGIIALDLPELMGRESWFDVIGHGYEIPKDGFGYQGLRLTPRPGGNHSLRVLASG